MKRKLTALVLILLCLGVGMALPASAAVAPQKDNDDAAVYSSGWAIDHNDAYYNGDVHFCNTPGSYMEYHFQGTAVRLLGAKADSHGMFDVYIDGIYQKRVDTFAASAQLGALLYEKTGLRNTTHILRIVVLSERNPAASAGYVDVDAFERWTEPNVIHNFEPVKENDAAGVYSSGWAEDTNSAYYNGDVHFSNTPGSTVTYTFYGTAIRIYGSYADTHGKFAVYVDDQIQGSIDTYAESARVDTVLYEKTGLPEGTHTIRAVVLSDRNPAASAGYVDIDAFEFWTEFFALDGEYAYLSDMSWTSAASGVGSVQKDANVSGNALNVCGVQYPKGLGLHAFSTSAPADIVYDISGSGYTAFSAQIGIDNGSDGNANGSAQFMVLADNVVVYDSGIVRGGETAVPVLADISGASVLTLRVLNGGDGYACDWANWCDARLIKAANAQVFRHTLNNSIMEAEIGTFCSMPTIFSLDLKDGAEKQGFLQAPSILPLIARVEIDGTAYLPHWELKQKSVSSTQLTLEYTEETLSLELSLTFCLGQGDAPLELQTEIRNRSDRCVTLYRQESLKTSVTVGENAELWRFHKDSGYADQTGIYVDPLQHDRAIICETNPKLNWNENGYIPCVYVSDEESGIYLAYEFPKGRIEAVSAQSTEGYQLSLSAGLNSSFKTDLPAGKTFTVPAAYLGVYCGDIDDGSNAFKKWFFETKSPESLRQNSSEPLIELARNIYGFDEKQYPLGIYNAQNKFVEQMKAYPSSQLGVELEVIDWGWWNYRMPSDWTGSSIYWPDGIAAAGTLAKQNGAEFALYYLLHDQYTGAPNMLSSANASMQDWFISQDESSLVYGGGTGRADLGNESCVSFIKDALLNSMNTNSVYSYRSDYEPILDDSYQINRHKYGAQDTAYWCADGYYEILDYLIENGKRYESCSSGGSLKDFATLRRASTIMATDTYDPLTLRKAFYDSSYCIPSAQIHLFSKVDYCYVEQEGGPVLQERLEDRAWDDYVFYSSLLASLSWCGDTPQKYAVMPKYTSIYKNKIRPLIRNANVYHVLERPSGEDWDAIEYYDPNTDNAIKGAVFVFKPTGADSKTIILKGLDPDYMYTIEYQDRREQNTTATGQQLMTTGLCIEMSGEKKADIIYLK